MQHIKHYFKWDSTDIGGRIAQIANLTDDTVKMFDNIPVLVPNEGSLAGREGIRYFDPEGLRRLFGDRKPVFGDDFSHFTMKYAYLELGLDGVVSRSEHSAEILTDKDRAAYCSCVAQVYKRLQLYIEDHAAKAKKMGRLDIYNNCICVAHKAPHTLLQALQLFWFVWTTRSDVCSFHVEVMGYHSSPLGRIDQLLYPFYKNDIESGVLDKAGAKALITEFFRKINSLANGDTLTNLIVGGSDDKGRDMANELTYMIMDIIYEEKNPEPHLCIRVHKNMTREYWDKTVKINLCGQGQGTIYMDDAIVPKLEEYGVSRMDALNYISDGCEEVLIDGQSNMMFYEMEAEKILELALFNGEENVITKNVPERQRWSRTVAQRQPSMELEIGFRSGNMAQARSFDELYSMFWVQYYHQIDLALDFVCGQIRYYAEDAITNPIVAGGYIETLDFGMDPHRDIFAAKAFQVHSGTVPAVSDALAAIKKCVFDDKTTTMEEIIKACKCDFEGYEPLRQRLLNAPKFGNDDDYVDDIAKDICEKFIKHVKERKTPSGKPMWPGIYSILFSDHSAITGATPDGRHSFGHLNVHVSPVPGRAVTSPTAIIRSIAKLGLKEGVAASPAFVTLSRSLIPEDGEGFRLVDALLKAAMEFELPIVSFSVNDKEALMDARIHPEEHRDLIVRVWGFNARFVELTPEMQEHIILRTM